MKYFCVACRVGFSNHDESNECPKCHRREMVVPFTEELSLDLCAQVNAPYMWRNDELLRGVAEIGVDLLRLAREAAKANAEGKTVVVLVDGVEVDRIEPRVR